MTPADIDSFFATLQAANPYPTSELRYTNTFELLVAVLLSAQATDVSVNKATHTLFSLAPTPQHMLELGAAGIEPHVKSIGLYRTKTKHLLATCRLLMERHGGEVPHDRTALEALPGVGRKTANVVLNVAFGEPTLAVDTHVFRVSNRTGLAPGKTPMAVENGLLRRVPPIYLSHAHHWLILHGRYICLARLPQCGRCTVTAWCDFFRALPVIARPQPGQAAPNLRLIQD